MDSDHPIPEALDAAERARGAYSIGCNCAESVLHSVAEALDLAEDALPATSGYAWTGGIDESGCLCGALAAAVSLAGQVAAAEGGTEAEQRARARVLADEIRSEFESHWRGTCCRIVRHGLEFGTPECVANCEEVTAFATSLAVEVLGRERALAPTGSHALARVSAATGVGMLLGFEVATLAAAAGSPVALGAVGVGAVLGVAWGVTVVRSRDARRMLARPGRMVAAVSALIALGFALTTAVAPEVATELSLSLADNAGVPAAAPALRAIWALSLGIFCVPAVVGLVRRRGSA
jgi:C_GCAxxG_C_C family probable redox protein